MFGESDGLFQPLNVSHFIFYPPKQPIDIFINILDSVCIIAYHAATTRRQLKKRFESRVHKITVVYKAVDNRLKSVIRSDRMPGIGGFMCSTPAIA